MITAERTIERLNGYEEELEGMVSRFNPQSLTIDRDDRARFAQLVIELRDLFNDSLGANSYSSTIIDAFNQGITNYTRSPSYNSVTTVKGVVAASRLRITENPDLVLHHKQLSSRAAPAVDAPSHQQIAKMVPLEYPERVSLQWLIKNVPYGFWLALLALLVSVFGLGLTVAGKWPAFRDLINSDAQTAPVNVPEQSKSAVERSKVPDKAN